MTAETENATVVFRRNVHDALWVIRIGSDEPLPTFVPGQYAELALPECRADGARKLIRRAYSIASSPRYTDYLEFFIALVEEGELTPRLCEVNVGDRVWLNPRVKGKFTLEAISPDKNLVMISTGTGIAPFVSMLQTYAGTARWNRCILFTGVRFAHDLGYEDEIRSLINRDTSISYIATTSREVSEPHVHGRVNELLEPARFRSLVGWDLDPRNTELLLCGNPAMIDQVTEQLAPQGFTPHSKKQPGQIHFERYW